MRNRFFRKSSGRKRKFALGRKARAICDRSGFEVAYRDTVIEPGTGLRVDKRWSDGMWNRVDHPQNFSGDTSESIALRDPRIDTYKPNINYLLDNEDGIILDDDNLGIYV